MDIQPVLGEAERLLEKGKPFVLATVVHTKGSTPQKPGAKLLIREDGTTVGTLGGGCVEADVWAEARIILDEGGSTQVRRFVLNEDIAAKDGLVCGGTMDILIDPLREQADLLPFFHEIMAAYQAAAIGRWRRWPLPMAARSPACDCSFALTAARLGRWARR